jgi:hypothetical protein
LGIGTWDSSSPAPSQTDPIVDEVVEGTRASGSKPARRATLRSFYAVEDILGHLMYVTWSLEEARQLAASVVLSGKVQRHLVAIRRISRRMAQPPSTESGDKPRPLPNKGPPPETRITNSGSTSGLTLGYYIEKHYNLAKVDLKTVHRIRMGNHLATLAKSKKTLDLLGLSTAARISDQIIALWHPVSEVATGGSDFMGTRVLNCDRRLLSLRYGIK